MQAAIFIMAVFMAVIFAVMLINTVVKRRGWFFPLVLTLIGAGLAVWSGPQAIKILSQAPKKMEEAANTSSTSSKSAPSIDMDTQKANNFTRQINEQWSKQDDVPGRIDYQPKEKAFKITLTSESLTKGVDYLMENPDKAEEVGWSTITDSLVKPITQEIQKIFPEDWDVYVVTNTNPDVKVYEIKNDQVVSELGQAK
jgi:hypothetical protein